MVFTIATISSGATRKGGLILPSDIILQRYYSVIIYFDFTALLYHDEVT